MIYKGDTTHPAQIYTDIQVAPDLSQTLERFFSQNYLGELPSQSRDLITIIHGPYSQPHLVRIDETNKGDVKQILNENGEVILTADNEQKVGIPQSKTIYNEFLLSRIARNYTYLGITTKMPHKSESLYGDFQPTQIFSGYKQEGYGLDPKLFLMAFFSQIAVEKKDSSYHGETYLVLHTDIPYFLAEGEKDNIAESMSFINDLAERFNLLVVIENNEKSKNRVFQEAIPWGIDPEDIAKIVIGFKNLGVCLDIKHCIVNGLDITEIQNKIQRIRNLGTNLVVHTRDKYVNLPEFEELMKYLFINAIPFAHEP